MGTKENPKLGFGGRLKLAREARGMSGAKLGLGLGETVGSDASRQTISAWEAERHYPSIHQLYRLCLKLGKTADELLFGDINPNIQKIAEAAAVIQELSESDRKALRAVLDGPAVSDENVEKKMPVTKRKETHK